MMNDAVAQPSDAAEHEDASGSLKGALLVDAIVHEAVRQGVRVEALYDRFGFAENYWLAILSGNRSLHSTAKFRLKLVADFLGRPLVDILTMADYLEPEDFVVRDTLDDELNLAYEMMRNDLRWGVLCPRPEDWDASPTATKILTVALYEVFFERALLSKAKVFQLERQPAESAETAEPQPRSRPPTRRRAAAVSG
jgi:hypothetical protein